MSRSKRQATIHAVEDFQPNVLVMKRATAPVKPLNAAQEQFMNLLKTKDLNFCYGAAGSGKAQPLYSKILTPEGWKTMGEMTVGQKVVSGLDGEECKVTAIYPQGLKDIYEITFSDGSKTRACLDHLWLAKVDIRKKRKSEVRVINTQEIIDHLGASKGNIRVPLIDPIVCEDVYLPIHPYLLGVLIGDGGLTNSVSLSTADIEIVDRVNSIINPEYTLVKRTAGSRHTYDYGLVKNNGYSDPQECVIKKSNKYKDYMVELGLHGHKSEFKFIPELYKKGSIKQRLDLIRGLMDTDGTACKHGGSVFYTSSERLAKDFQEVAWSIGAKCSLNNKQTYYTYKGKKLKGLPSYVLNISYKYPKELFTLERKRDRVSEKHDMDQITRVIKKVELVGTDYAQCISIDHPSHTYVTDDYIVTHNTYIAGSLAAEALESHKISKIIVTRPAIEADGEEMGFLPGELDEKFAPWFEPFRDVLEERLGAKTVDYHIKKGTIVPTPLAYMRGKSFKDAWVIMDEAQNSTPGQMKMFLTRMGEGCQMTILGDIKQSDLKIESGMQDAIRKLRGMPEVGFHEFRIEDCVRHGIVKKILERYER